MKGLSREAPAPSGADGSHAIARLAAVRIRGFHGIGDLRIELDPVTTIIGEDGAAKVRLVEILDRCLGPGPDDLPAFDASDFAAPEGRGASRGVRASFEFVEGAAGAWAREPDLARLAHRGPERRLRLIIDVGADRAGRPATFIEAAGSRARRDAVLRAWKRLRILSPVLVLGADRDRRSPTRARSSNHAEIARLYKRLRDSHGCLSEDELASARAVLRDGMHLDAPPARPGKDERALVDVIDWRRTFAHDVTDDAVQEILLRLLRAGLMLDAQRERRIHPDASPIVVVDSPDARLHPTLVARVWRFLHSVATQIIVTTNSAEVVAASPLRGLRRLVPRDGRIAVTRVISSDFSIDDLRRIIYHVRLRRGSSLLARTWFLLEGETEVWILSEFAAMLGYSLAAEGVACIEFAQCGLAPLLRLADQLGISWHVLADGDPAGVIYANQARSRLANRSARNHVTMIDALDIENLLWQSGYADVFKRSAGNLPPRELPRKAVIRRALDRASKPLLAIRVIERALKPGSPGVPAQLARAINAVVALARRAAARHAPTT